MYYSTSLERKKTGSGVVHGHIHNYNNLTYIHGHVHHNALETELSDLNADPQLQSHSNSQHQQQNNSNANLSHSDCKPFEFFDFHNNGNITPFSTIQLDQVPSNNNNNNTQFKRKFEELDDNILSQVLPKSKKVTAISSSNNNSNTTKITEDDCTPKIFEICCDINHGKLACHNKDGTKVEVLPTIQSTNNNNNNLMKDDNILLNNANFLTQNLPTDSLTSHNNNNNDTLTNIELQNNMKYLSDLNCNFDCDFDCDTINNNTTTNNSYMVTPSDSHNNNGNTSNNESDFFDRYCQLCENDEPHEQHVYDSEKTPMTSKTIISSNSTKSLDNKGNSDQTDNVKLNQDMKILEDLCNISSLYEVPFAQHMSHHHQQMNKSSNTNNTSTVDVKDKNGNETTPIPQNHSASNLLEPVIRSRLMEKLKNNNENNNNVIVHDHPPHHHHHHKIELHTHVPMINNPTVLDNNKSKQTILNNAINFHVDSKMDPDDENNNLIPDIKPETMNEFNTLHANNNLNELNTINFNWNFKRDEDNDMKCLWDDCHSGTGFNNLIDLQKHMFVDHVPTKKDDYSCHWQDCLFQGNDVCSLVNHINDHHGINFGIKINEPDPMTTPLTMKQEPIELKKEEEPTIYQCQWGDCRLKFESSRLLNEHIESEHIPKRQSNYMCHWHSCDKNFTQRQKLLRHIKVHTGYKPFRCKVCNKTFANQETLTQHNRTHSGEKPYKCDICGKCFGGSSSLKIHIRTHTGEKPLKCRICGKRFNESSNLNKHLKTHTKEYCCDHCGKRFATAKTLKTHESSGCCYDK